MVSKIHQIAHQIHGALAGLGLLLRFRLEHPLVNPVVMLDHQRES
jgi:hypothetical protein